MTVLWREYIDDMEPWASLDHEAVKKALRQRSEKMERYGYWYGDLLYSLRQARLFYGGYMHAEALLHLAEFDRKFFKHIRKQKDY